MKRILLLHTCLLLLLLQNGCSKPGCTGAAGNTVTKERSLSSFEELVLEDNISLVLVQGTASKMEITAPENIQSNITAQISNGVLTISNSTDCRWARDAEEKISVRLYFTDLKKIAYQGSGDITNEDTLRLESLQVESYTGAGNISLTIDNGYTGAYVFKENAGITLQGKTAVCFTYTNARGQADMRNLTAKKMVIEYGGLGDTYIHVTEELDAIVYYKGNVHYSGNPVITRNEHYSSGRLIHHP